MLGQIRKPFELPELSYMLYHEHSSEEWWGWMQYSWSIDCQWVVDARGRWILRTQWGTVWFGNPPPYSETIQSSYSAEWLWMDLFSKKFQIVLKSREINQAVSKNRLHEIHGRLCWSCKDFLFLNSPVKVLLNPCSVIKFTNSLFDPILF